MKYYITEVEKQNKVSEKKIFYFWRYNQFPNKKQQ